ncbi:LCP family protein [Aciduricibacillus chroicocephali]|uniref:Regulatory protein MsrR n=1 Tax=Aciduricibacillus chroicocephali TaxID=3054939 RepID=A0ABY9KVS4_9BACI|nr:LCP family protein [Bacillaceae bacterium 44XB]
MISRKERERSKRKGKGFKRFFLLLILIVVAGAVIFGFMEYRKGLKEAGDGSYKNDGEQFGEFDGETPKSGEIKILMIGNDARQKDGGHGRSDTMMIGYYNQKTNETKLVSLMRDLYVDIPGHGKQKLNAAFSIGGPELVRQTIKENFGVDINYYAVVDFAGFPKLIDLLAPEGIKVNIPETMSYGIGMTLHPGEQTLNGKETLAYVRFRHDAQSDFGRVKRQQEVLEKVKEQALRAQTIVKLPKLLGLTDPYVDTNISNGTLFSIGKGMLLHNSKGVETMSLPVAGSYSDLRTDVGLVLNADIQQNSQALQQFLSGSK